MTTVSCRWYKCLAGPVARLRILRRIAAYDDPDDTQSLPRQKLDDPVHLRRISEPGIAITTTRSWVLPCAPTVTTERNRCCLRSRIKRWLVAQSTQSRNVHGSSVSSPRGRFQLFSPCAPPSSLQYTPPSFAIQIFPATNWLSTLFVEGEIYRIAGASVISKSRVNAIPWGSGCTKTTLCDARPVLLPKHPRHPFGATKLLQPVCRPTHGHGCYLKRKAGILC